MLENVLQMAYTASLQRSFLSVDFDGYAGYIPRLQFLLPSPLRKLSVIYIYKKLGGGGDAGARIKIVVYKTPHSRKAMPLQQQTDKRHNTKGCLLCRITFNTHRVIRDEHKTNTTVNDNNSIDTCNNAKKT